MQNRILVYGTGNPAKLLSMRECLAPLGIELIGVNEMEIDIPEIEECGSSPLENARIKAHAYYKLLNRPVFACDSGLYIDGLSDQEQPGVHVRMREGRRLSDDEMTAYYASIAKRLGGKARAQYQNAICLVMSETEVYEHCGDTISGEAFHLVDQPHSMRNPGFPLDCISVHIETSDYYDWHGVNSVSSVMDQGFREFFEKILRKFKY